MAQSLHFMFTKFEGFFVLQVSRIALWFQTFHNVA